MPTLHLLVGSDCIPVAIIYSPTDGGYPLMSGDTGEGEDPTEGQLIKESDHVYSLWASGRQHCTGMMVQLRVGTPRLGVGSPSLMIMWIYVCACQFCRRHDLFSVLMSLFSPQTDTAVRDNGLGL